MKILDRQLERMIAEDILAAISQGNYNSASEAIRQVLEILYTKIPDARRTSYGRVFTIKVLSEYLFRQLNTPEYELFENASILFNECRENWCKGVALGVLSLFGLENYHGVLPHFEIAARSPHWEIREFAQMFFRKLIQKYPQPIREYLLVLVNSDDPNIRRFVAETLRPVQENQWIYDKPDYSLTILKHLFSEPVRYPRTSVGNNLSDLSRRLPDLIFEVVEELVERTNPNSFWIAYRACRNLVKKDPTKVMDILQIDEYRYKNRVHRRRDLQAR
ncbi:MAG: hypothetical protein ACFFD8_01045 [Candidatus Thorarchaeota archaeon]